MSSTRQKEFKRRDVWAETKFAAGAYARNPCAATERDVESAVDHLRHLNEEAKPNPSQDRRGD